MHKNMNKEILKYSIYYLELRKDEYGNVLNPYIGNATWIKSTKDYDHTNFELHHVIPFTDWEKNTKNVRNLIKNNALILLPKVMHQHLENSIYRLSKEDFKKIYGISPDKILFDINSRLKRVSELFYMESDNKQKKLFFSLTEDIFNEEDCKCFDSISA